MIRRDFLKRLAAVPLTARAAVALPVAATVGAIRLPNRAPLRIHAHSVDTVTGQRFVTIYNLTDHPIVIDKLTIGGIDD